MQSIIQGFAQGFAGSAKAIALQQEVAPRTLQRFLESITWDEQKLRYRCQTIIATKHARRNAAAAKSHKKTCYKQLVKLGIDPGQIKSIHISSRDQ